MRQATARDLCASRRESLSPVPVCARSPVQFDIYTALFVQLQVHVPNAVCAVEVYAASGLQEGCYM
jgi:hypothetical protein